MQVYDPWGCNTGMISSNDFRTGTTIELDGQVWRVVEFLHVKPGKGSAFVRTKLKSVQSGNVVEKTFRAGESVQQAILEKSNLQHTYVESGDYVFMDMTSFEETRLTSEQIGKGSKYLKEGMEVNVIFHNGKVLEVELPISITLKVTETDPGVKGDTASGGTKPAGFVPPLAVSPLTPGSVSVTFKVIDIGSSTSKTLPLWKITLTSIPSFKYFEPLPICSEVSLVSSKLVMSIKT